MNFQRYIAALVFLLSGFGIFSQYGTVKPNQEIIVQFQDDISKCANSVDALISLRAQLTDIGVDEIVITEQADGTLKISYYSVHDVSEIRSLLLNESTLDVSFTDFTSNKTPLEFPLEDDTKSFQLSITIIKKASDNNIGQAGKSIVVQKSDVERFLNPNYFYSGFSFYAPNDKKSFEKVVSIFNDTQFVLSDHSYKIPETRAGPVA